MHTKERLLKLWPTLQSFPELGLTSFEQLQSLVELELHHPQALDGWIPYGRQLTRAIRPKTIYLICPHNLAISAWQGITRALILGSSLHVKLSSTQAESIRRFLRALPPEFRRSVTSSIQPCLARLKRAEAVIAMGSDSMIEEVRLSLSPQQKFLAYGTQTSLLWLGRLRRFSTDLLKKITADLCTYDQLGCLSPQSIYLLKGSATTQFCQALGKTLDQCPLPRLSQTEHLQRSALIRSFRAETPAAQMWTPSDRGTGWTIFQHRSVGFQLGCGYRNVHVYEIALSELPRALRALQNRISTVGYRAPLALAAERIFLSMGVKRFCSIGQCQFPAPFWHHDGRPQLSDLVTWVDRES